MNKTRTPLLLIIGLMTLAHAQLAHTEAEFSKTVFAQDFSKGGEVEDYVDTDAATSNTTHFTQNPFYHVTLSITDKRLVIKAPGDGTAGRQRASFKRGTDTSSGLHGSPLTVAKLEFLVNITNTEKAPTSDRTWGLGDASKLLNNRELPPPAARMFMAAGYQAFMDGTWRLRSNRGRAESGKLDQGVDYRITLVGNATDADITYTTPNGTSSILPTASYDVWFGEVDSKTFLRLGDTSFPALSDSPMSGLVLGSLNAAHPDNMHILQLDDILVTTHPGS